MIRLPHTIFVALAITLVMAFGVSAQTEPDSLLLSYVREAWTNHPDLKAMRAMVEAESSRTAMARAWMNPELRGGLMNVPEDFNTQKDPMTMFQIGVMQEVPLPGKLKAAANAGRARTESAKADVQDQQNQMAAMVAMAYFDLAAAQQVRKSLERGRDLTQQSTDAATAALSTGTGSQADVLRSRVETEEWNRRLVSNEADMERKRAALAYAIGRDDANAVTVSDLPEVLPALPDLEAALNSESLENTPEVQSARLQAKAAAASAKGAGLAISSVGLGAAYGIRRDLKTNGSDPHTGRPTEETVNQDNMVTLEVTVPLPLFYGKNQRAQTSEFRAMRRQAQYEAEKRKLAKAQELRELHALIKEKLENYRITAESVLPQAESGWQASLLDYRGNKLPFMTLNEARMNLVMAEMDAVMLKADAWAAYFRWQAALGQLAIRTGVN